MILWAFLVVSGLVSGVSTAVAAEGLRAKEPPRAAPKQRAATAQPPAPAAEEIWSLKVDGKPTAVFFDAASSSLFVSVRDGKKLRLDKVSLEGKLEDEGFAKTPASDGQALHPLRAYLGDLYWSAGKGKVLVVDKDGDAKPLPGAPDHMAERGIAVDRKGAVYLAGAGQIVKVTEGKEETFFSGPVNGIFLLNDRLFLNSGAQVLSLELAKPGGKPRVEGKLGGCIGLERSSSGAWLCAREPSILAGDRELLTLKQGGLGHFAYVYRMDSTQDFLVVPFREEGMLRAYRMPGTEPLKKTDK